MLGSTYFVAAKLGLMLALVHPSASAVWAPTAIALISMLLLGNRMWPAIFVAAFLVNLSTAGTPATSLGIATGNTLEALTGAWLVRRFANGRSAFERPQDTFRFAVLAGLAATAVSASFGVTSLALGGFAPWSDFRSIWLTWWLGDLGGALVVAPFLLIWTSPRRAISWSRAQLLELAALLLSLTAVGVTVFWTSFPLDSRGHPLEFVCIPFLVWAAFRFDQRIASLALLVNAAIAVSGTMHNVVVVGRSEMNEWLVVLQLFMGVAAVTTLALAAMVAERRRVEAAVRATSQELSETVAELEAFAHSMSHDLRSPVGAVLNYSAVIEEDFGGHLDESGMHLLRRIQASARSAADMLDQLVQFGWARSELSDRAPIDMTSLARAVHDEIASGSAEAADLDFEVEDLPPAWGSAELLRCVFRNLISNAIKYTRGRGQRRIEIRGLPGETENTYSVSDNGIGFDPALGDAVFQPFFRAGSSGEVEGSGLGLAIVARIVQRHQGRVWAESDGATGARFSFTLPSREPR